MGDVVRIDFKETTGKVAPEKVLTAALEENLREVAVVGLDSENNLYCAFSDGDILDILGALDIARDQILRAIND